MTELNNTNKPNIYRTQASEITPGSDAMVPRCRPLLMHAVCSERMPLVRCWGDDGSAKRFLFLVTLTFDL